MNLLVLQNDEIDPEGRVNLREEQAKHVVHVLKASVGKNLRIGLLNGPFGTGTVESIQKLDVILRCQFERPLPPRPQVDLLLAMPRPKVLKRLWAQFAALGVNRIILINAEKVERFFFDSHVLDPPFYTARLVEGLQQARCTQLPKVMIRKRFKPFVEDELGPLFQGQIKLLADPSGSYSLSRCLAQSESERTVLAIGPEGGWTSYELEKLKASGFQLFGLGRRILRTDTACVGLLTALQCLRDTAFNAPPDSA